MCNLILAIEVSLVNHTLHRTWDMYISIHFAIAYITAEC